MKINRIISALFFTAALATVPVMADDITVTTSPSDQQIAMLSGSQFDFFAPPIRSRLLNKELLQSWKSIPLKVMRYPGGTWCDHYIWNNPSAGYFVVGDAKSIVTPEQFIATCRAIDAEPIFQVNVMSYDNNANRINPNKIEQIKMGAKRAAEWVQHANIKNKWNVKYWEIGNEVWIWLDGKEYARYVVEYSKAMKAVDPSIKIIACGLSSKVGPFNPSSFFDFKKTDPTWKPRTAVVNEAKDWSDALLTIANGHFDYLAPHPYISGTSKDDPKQLYLETTAKIWQNEGLQSQYDALARHPESKAGIAITEWACNFGFSVPGSSGKIPPAKGYYYMLGNGINMAFYFGRMLEDSRNELAIAHSLCDMQTLWYWPKHEMASGAPLEHPSIMGIRMWNANLGSKRMTVQTSSMPKMQISGKDYPSVYLFASEDTNSKFLVAINLDPTKAHRIVWKQTGTTPLRKMLLNGPSVSTQNFDDWGKPTTAAAISTDNVNPDRNGNCVIELPPHSMTALKTNR